MIGWAKVKSPPEEGGIDNNNRKLKRKRSSSSAVPIAGAGPELNLVAPSEDAKTLYISNLASTVVAKDLESLFTDVASVRRPNGRDFAFVEFTTHEAAKGQSYRERYWYRSGDRSSR